MGFSCGCQVLPASTVTPQVLRKHMVHTLEAMLFWELLGRRHSPSNQGGQLKLSQARLNYLEAVTELYPEASEQEKEESHR